MGKPISTPNEREGDHRNATGTDFTSLDSENKRGIDVNLGSSNGEFYNRDRNGFNIVNRDVGHNAALVVIEKLLEGYAPDTFVLTAPTTTTQVLSAFESGTNILEIQIQYTADGWSVTQYFGAALLESGDYLLLENGDRLLFEG